MSLFPAYCQDGGAETIKKKDKQWLENSSFPADPTNREINEKVNVAEEKFSKSHREKDDIRKIRKKKKKKKLHVELDTILIEENDIFCIDKQRQTSYSSIKTLPKSIRPRYNAFHPGLFPLHILKQRQKTKRYYKNNDIYDGFDKGTMEEESIVAKKTEDFNKKLSENPQSICTWIDFVNFQDEFYKYQHIKYKSSIERERIAAQHKLSILDKAIEKNPDNKELQALWLKIGTSVLPSEEMSKQIDEILQKSGGTITLWLGLMTTTQYSLSRCTTPSVSKLYEKLLLNFQNAKQHDSNFRDSHVLELLFHYCRFLDNCGQWETLWTIVKVNLQLNTKIQMNFHVEVDEKVKQLENEVVKKKKRAVWQMWSQMERFREGLHFLPDSDSQDYPQRCVALENVMNFTWHFYPDIHFQLIISFINIMKVPLLPSTHTLFKLLAPNSLPWVFDSPEFILASVLVTPCLNLSYNFLRPITQLSRGPQYLRKLHGQEEFLDLISFTFKECLRCLENRQKTALGVWWLRFVRWINLLHKLSLASLPDSKLSTKKFFKEFLALEENRENLMFYIEYCLYQHNQGNTEACLKALKTLISSRPPVLTLQNYEEKGNLTAVYRTLCEVLVGTNKRNEALNLLINLGNGIPADASATIHTLVSAEKQFSCISRQIINEENSATECLAEDLLLPNFIVEWLSCYLWFIALTKGSVVLHKCFEEIIATLEEKNILMENKKECLWETFLTISYTLNKNNFSYIKEILQKSLTIYPHNLKILSFMASHSLEYKALWWTFRKTFLSPPTIFGAIFLVCVALEKFGKNKEDYQNRLKSLFTDLILKEGKLSSTIHCLRLRFLYDYDHNTLEVAQLQALESCPWNKSVYMDSILLLPSKLMQLTDIMIEKELKIHITPDEIQEMRD